MFMGSGQEIANSIRGLTQTQATHKPIRLAIAFWGQGTKEMLDAGKQYRIICNLTAGGTNPQVIEELRRQNRIDVRHLPSLHAKVGLFDTGAVVSSANFSIDGLGLEGQNAGSWVEAGYALASNSDAYSQVVNWFDRIWAASEVISDELIEDARSLWAMRFISQSPSKPINFSGAVSGSITEPPSLTDIDVFEAALKPRNRIRMAAKWLVERFSEIEEINNTSRFVPAYVANIIWTRSGGTVATNISGLPFFSSPAQVIERANDISKTHLPRIRSLLSFLCSDPKTPPAVKYWASKSLETFP